jgi:hypothetical protein
MGDFGVIHKLLFFRFSNASVIGENSFLGSKQIITSILNVIYYLENLSMMEFDLIHFRNCIQLM